MRQNYIKVFLTSTKRERERFFHDPLIGHLWQDFRMRRPDLIRRHTHPDPMTSSENICYLADKFLAEVRATEFKVDVAILPP